MEVELLKLVLASYIVEYNSLIALIHMRMTCAVSNKIKIIDLINN